jgi:hypothetical protein
MARAIVLFDWPRTALSSTSSCRSVSPEGVAAALVDASALRGAAPCGVWLSTARGR